MASTQLIRNRIELEIPLPPLQVQRQIVAEIEDYQKVISANQELIDRVEKKITAAIGRVWGAPGAKETAEGNR